MFGGYGLYEKKIEMILLAKVQWIFMSAKITYRIMYGMAPLHSWGILLMVMVAPSQSCIVCAMQPLVIVQSFMLVRQGSNARIFR
jgi:hypothetical protein